MSFQTPEQESCVSSSEVQEEMELPSAAEYTQEIIEEETRKGGKVELTVYKWALILSFATFHVS